MLRRAATQRFASFATGVDHMLKTIRPIYKLSLEESNGFTVALLLRTRLFSPLNKLQDSKCRCNFLTVLSFSAKSIIKSFDLYCNLLRPLKTFHSSDVGLMLSHAISIFSRPCLMHAKMTWWLVKTWNSTISKTIRLHVWLYRCVGDLLYQELYPFLSTLSTLLCAVSSIIEPSAQTGIHSPWHTYYLWVSLIRILSCLVENFTYLLSYLPNPAPSTADIETAPGKLGVEVISSVFHD